MKTYTPRSFRIRLRNPLEKMLIGFLVLYLECHEWYALLFIRRKARSPKRVEGKGHISWFDPM